jgi:glyoxylate reductase
MGRIGRAVKRRAEPFGLKTIYYNRNRLPDSEAAGAEYVLFDKLLSDSDIISVHVPLNSKTRHLIGEREIQQMKDGVVIVNTARGAVIDEAAMAAALESGRIASVGLDVYEREPEINETLAKNSRALLIPHLGTHTIETLAKMETLAMENARRGCFEQPLLTIVAEQLKGGQAVTNGHQ